MLLGILRHFGSSKNFKSSTKTKIYQASTSELYGLIQESPQKETTPFYPRSPYFFKTLCLLDCFNYREANNIFACNILFNH